MMICGKCKNELDESLFNANAHQKNGKQPWCKDCTTEYSRQWYQRNKEKHIAYVQEHDKRKKPRTCKHCGLTEPDVIFALRKRGNREYKRFICMACEVVYKLQYPTTEAARKRDIKHRAAKGKIRRADESLRCKYILHDSKRGDKRKGRDNDLDREFIRGLIDEGCSYCADNRGKMTLDRIDNRLGHLKSNVVACCMRCNYIRRDMPHEVWLMVAPKIRQARLLGLLEGWNPGTIKSQRKVSTADLELAKYM